MLISIIILLVKIAIVNGDLFYILWEKADEQLCDIFLLSLLELLGIGILGVA